VKTFGGFVCHQPLPGLYLWRTPSGLWFRVDHTGTHALGLQIPDIIRQRNERHRFSYAERHLLTRIAYQLGA